MLTPALITTDGTYSQTELPIWMVAKNKYKSFFNLSNHDT